MFNLQNFYYTYEEKYSFIYDAISDLRTMKNNKGIEYFNVPCAFDIETTSFISSDNEKTAIMYIWQFGINGRVIIGRKWQQFISLLDDLTDELKLSSKKRLIVYVHNLAFEFQFLCKRFSWERVFAIDVRKPIYAVTDKGIEFRCAYLLSGYSLESVGKNLQKYKVQKLVGNLDYSLIRHEKTKLTQSEIEYCINDVRVVMAYIQELIENNNGIINLPLTKTGFVRRYCKKQCLGKNIKNYRKLMSALTIHDVEEYKQLKRAFQGGFTHANAFYSGKILDDVASYDFTSSYPYVMLSEHFPMSKSRLVEVKSKEQLKNYLKNYCCLFDVRFKNLTPKINFENYISVSKCWELKNYVANNGRVVQADSLITTVTEQDFLIINYCYEFEEIEIANFRIYEKSYLPKDFVMSIIKLYSDKTKLKGVEGKEVEYLLSKGMLNSCYGMCVTDICRDEFLYKENWYIENADYETSIEKYNSSKSRFLFYPWGIWVTAYARRNLFEGIAEFENDYVYSDTDSLKVLNYRQHENFIKAYNEHVKQKLKLACKYHKIPFDEMSPKNIKGETKLIGIWDFEGVYKRFKTLGAKRYMVETVNKNGMSEFSFTVSGCNKKFAIPYMLEKFGAENMFESFSTSLDIPAGYTGKMTHIYIDDDRKGMLTDYQGVTTKYDELSGIYLENAGYSLSLAESYIKYLLGFRES